MKNILIAGVALIVLGAAVLGYDQYSYTTREKILQIGPITATADQSHTVFIPPVFGWLMIGSGICALALATLTKKP